ncbi:MAG: ABC transporter permease [Coraliomargarita sp.]
MKAFQIRFLPFAYATRNLLRDIPRLLQKIGGSCAVVFLVLAAGAFNEGMKSVLRASGSDHNVILLSAGSEESVERGEIDVQVESLAASIRGIESRLGQPAVSGEVHFMGELVTSDGTEQQALLRGITAVAFEVHREARILEGNFPATGEVLVGRLAHHMLGLTAEELRPGASIEFEGQAFTVSGVFEAPGTVMESEVWFDRNDLMTLTQRESLSCVIVRLEDPKQFSAVDLFAKQRLNLELSAIREIDYYDKLSGFFAPIRAMTWLTAGLIAAGAIFGGFNLLYAAFASRIRELATLQAIGFRRTAVFVSLVQESLLATLSGTLLAAFAAVFILEGRAVHFSIGTFSLELSSPVITAGLMMGLLLGVLGAVPPAIRCLGAPLTSTLRS